MRHLVIASIALALLAGCTTVKRMTGQIDDTILPGQRQEILPPDQQVLRDPTVSGNLPVPSNGASVPAPLADPQKTDVTPMTGTCDPKVDYCANPGASSDANKISKVQVKKRVSVKKKNKKKKPVATASPPSAGADAPPPVPAPPPAQTP